MRKQDHVVHGVERAHRMARVRERLAAEYVERRAGDALLLQAPRPAPPRPRSRRATTLIRNADGFIRPSSRAPIRWRVSALSTAWIETTSLRAAARRRSSTFSMPPARIASRRHMRIVADDAHAEARRHPRHAAADLAGADRSRACGRPDRARAIAASARPSLRVAISRPIGISFFASAIISANAPSATVSSAYSGTLTTGMPRAHRGRDIDRVDPDAVFDDALELRRRLDDARRDRRVAHQQEVGVAHRGDQLVFARRRPAASTSSTCRSRRPASISGHSSSRSVRTALKRAQLAVPIGEIPRDRGRNAEDRDERADLVDQRNAGLRTTPTAPLRSEAASHTQMNSARAVRRAAGPSAWRRNRTPRAPPARRPTTIAMCMTVPLVSQRIRQRHAARFHHAHF